MIETLQCLLVLIGVALACRIVFRRPRQSVVRSAPATSSERRNSFRSEYSANVAMQVQPQPQPQPARTR